MNGTQTVHRRKVYDGDEIPGNAEVLHAVASAKADGPLYVWFIQEEL